MMFKYNPLYNKEDKTFCIAVRDVESDIVFVTKEYKIDKCSCKDYLSTIGREESMNNYRLMNTNQLRNLYGAYTSKSCDTMVEAIEEGFIMINRLIN